MNKASLISYIESSFIKDIIMDKDITDISYNGKDIYYASNINGRKKSETKITPQEAKDFLRQIANISEKQFSYLNPILDLNIGKYRINGVNSSICKNGEDEATSFSIRIASKEPRIKHNEEFMDKDVEDLLDCLLANHISIVIAGVPGVGKTELQKYLLSRINEKERIIIIDQTVELMLLQEGLPHDITVWQVDDKNIEASISNLIKNGLRNNPDWMILSEARGEEMNDVLTSAMTGIPIITTIHSYDAFSAPIRMSRMVMQSEKNMRFEDVYSNIIEHFKIYIYLKKRNSKSKGVVRYISSIVEVDESGNKNEIYYHQGIIKKYAKITKSLISLLSDKLSLIKNGRFYPHE